MQFIPNKLIQKDKLSKLDKVRLFKDELNLIGNKNLRSFTAYVLSELPDYSFTSSASGSGKYHSQQELGKFGQTVHIKRVVYIGKCLLELEQFKFRLSYKAPTNFVFDSIERDCIISALILHDGLKYGNDNKPTDRATMTHPIDMANFVLSCFLVYKQQRYVEDCMVNKILACIRSHMGEWVKDREGNIVLPKPITPMQQFVHMCDYLGSREFLTFENIGVKPIEDEVKKVKQQ